MLVNYYPGCTLHGTAEEYHDSIVSVFRLLGVDLVELDDWNCCGASSAHVLHPQAAVELPARNLLIASRNRAPLLAPCAACFHRLKLAQAHLEQHPDSHPESSAIVAVEVVHINEMLYRDPIREKFSLLIKSPLSGLKVAPYYGCLTVRPPAAMKHPRPEDPQEMDSILRALGAEVVNWSYKTDCCGGNLAMTRPDVVRRLSGKLFGAAKEAGADALVTDCPMCQANLDTREKEIESETHTSFRIPVVYITELMALALGVEEASSWWRRHLVDPVPLLKSKGLVA